MRRVIGFNILAVLCLVILCCGNSCADGSVNLNLFELEQARIKYNFNNSTYNNPVLFAASGTSALEEIESDDSSDEVKYRSPGKAFILSMAIPGLGQYYNGSRIKPFLFLGVEVTSWIFNVKLNNEGDDITDEFQAFQNANWSRENYEQKYLLWTYGYADDDSITAKEVSHHLPDEKTQQYYEMTGKYDQFAWGWNDAVYEGNMIDDYSVSNPPIAITSDPTTPYSAKRLYYEDRRNDANNKYDQARRMVYVALLNRLVSAFEAMISAKNINKAARSTGKDFTSLKFGAKLKSYHTKRDTPFITATYKF